MTTMMMLMALGRDLLAGLVSSVTPGLAAALVLKSSVLVILTGAAAVALGRRSAALRHFMWSLALGGALAMPLVATSLPWSLRVLPVPSEATAQRSPVQAGAGLEKDAGEASLPGARPEPSLATLAAAVDGGEAVDGAEAGAIEQDAGPATRAGTPWITRTLGVSVWAGVAALLLLHLALGRFFLWLMARRGTEVEDPLVVADFRRLQRASGVGRPVRLLWSRRARVPLTWGVFRPVVVLPAEAREWESERLALVLHHELAHVRRLDDITHVLAWVACALHWFNPLMWWAAARLRDESEHASDDMVLEGGARASDYARHLLAVVSAMGPRSAPVGAVPLAQRSSFEGRLLAILDAGRHRERVRRPGALCLALGTAGLVVLLGAVQPAPAPSPEQEARAPDDIAQPVRQPDHRDATARAPRTASAGAETGSAAADDAGRDSDVEATSQDAGAGASGAPMPAEVDAGSAPRDSVSVRALANALLQDSDAEVRRSAAWALGQLEDRRGTSALSQALSGDTSVEVRRMAAWALGQVEDASAVSALGAALDDEDQEVRTTALWALGQIESPEAVEPLARVLGSPDPESRRTAAWALGQIESREAVAPLAAALHDEDPEVRDQVVWALGQIESDEAVRPLTPLLRDPSPQVRQQVAWALGQIESEEATEALAAVLSDSDDDVAKMAAWALGQIEPVRAPQALLEAARTWQGDKRATAIWALTQIEDPAAVPVYAEMLKDADPSIRSAALRGLAEVRDEAALRAITDLLQDPDPEVRAAAVRALAGRGGWGGNPRPWPQPRPQPRPNGG